MPKLFISHSSADKPFVRRLHDDLVTLGNTAWLDEREIGVGDPIVENLQQGLDWADYVVLVLSKSSVASNWVKTEWQSTYWDEIGSGGVTVLPILLEDCTIPRFLRQKKYADFRNAPTDPGKYALGLADLNRALHSASTKSGISTYYSDFVDADAGSVLFKESDSLDLVIMYGNTWRNTYLKLFEEMLRRGGRVRVVLPAVDDNSLCDVYARRLGVSQASLRLKVAEAVDEFSRLAAFGRVELFTSEKYFNQAIYLFDEECVLALYSFREGRVPTPAMVISQGDFLAFLRSDFEWLIDPMNPRFNRIFP